MLRWQHSVPIVLCLYGLTKEFRPIEPYLYRYQHTFLNISGDVLSSQVYPLWTYSYLVLSIPTMLLTDLLLYKPVLLVESVSYIGVWLSLIFGRTVWSQQLGQVIYGLATATEVAYFAYIYVKVDRKMYSRVTAWSRAALQLGKCMAYLMAQFLLLLCWADYRTLNFISLGSLSLTFIFAILLPFVHWHDLVVHKRNNEKAEDEEIIEGDQHQKVEIRGESTYWQFVAGKICNFWCQFQAITSDAHLSKWSLWWTMATCGDLMIGNYIQLLWGEVQTGSARNNFNGFVEGTIPLLAALSIIAVQKLNFNWSRWGELALFLTAFAEFLALAGMSRSGNVYSMYAGYAVVRILYQISITVAQFNIASRINVSNSGFAFGLNMFAALALQALITFVVVDANGPLSLPIRPQFAVYALYHGLISAIFLFSLLYRIFSTK